MAFLVVILDTSVEEEERGAIKKDKRTVHRKTGLGMDWTGGITKKEELFSGSDRWHQESQGFLWETP